MLPSLLSLMSPGSPLSCVVRLHVVLPSGLTEGGSDMMYGKDKCLVQTSSTGSCCVTSWRLPVCEMASQTPLASPLPIFMTALRLRCPSSERALPAAVCYNEKDTCAQFSLAQWRCGKGLCPDITCKEEPVNKLKRSPQRGPQDLATPVSTRRSHTLDPWERFSPHNLPALQGGRKEDR